MDLVCATFGSDAEKAAQYAATLCSVGIERGVIGPSEAPRIWDRHLLNCGVIAPAFPFGARVVDVGSGAGLPGIPLALARGDLKVTLLDSLARRVRFLVEVAAALELAARVSAVQGRAEEHRQRYDVVTARAVAPLGVLGRWTARLVESGGLLLAMRGGRAERDVFEAAGELRRAGWTEVHVVTYGHELPTPTRIVKAVKR